VIVPEYAKTAGVGGPGIQVYLLLHKGLLLSGPWHRVQGCTSALRLDLLGRRLVHHLRRLHPAHPEQALQGLRLRLVQSPRTERANSEVYETKDITSQFRH